LAETRKRELIASAKNREIQFIKLKFKPYFQNQFNLDCSLRESMISMDSADIHSSFSLWPQGAPMFEMIS